MDETLADLVELLEESGASPAVQAFYRASFGAAMAAAGERAGPFAGALATEPRLRRAFLVACAVDHMMRALNGGDAIARSLIPHAGALVPMLDRLFDLGADGLGACEAAAEMFVAHGPDSGDYGRVLFQIAGDAGARQRWYGEFRDTVGRSWREFRARSGGGPA